MNTTRSIWKDAAIVIMITMLFAVLMLPFRNKLPLLLDVFVNHNASIIGYSFICYRSNMVDIRHLVKVSLTVWVIFTPLFTTMCWDTIGTKHTAYSIIFGGLLSESISLVISVLTYLIVAKIKNTITIKNVLIKPKGLKETTILMGIFNLAGVVFFDPNFVYLGFEIFLFTVLITISYLVLWYYWQGRNWARIIAILGSILSIFNLFYIGENSFVKASLLVAEAVLGLFLLWWLNTESAKIYFSKSRVTPDQEDAPA